MAVVKKGPPDYILFCSELFQYYGGVSDYTNNLARQLKKKGRLRFVVALFAEKFAFDYDVVQFDAPIRRRSYSLDKWKIFSKVFTLIYFINLYYSSRKALRKLVKKGENSCIIFSEYYTKNFDIIIRCARLLKIRYGIIFHGLDLLCAKNKQFIHFRRNFEAAEFVVFNSHATEDLCQDLFHLRAKRSLLLYPGIDISRVQSKYQDTPRESALRPHAEAIIFSTVSRLIERKGIDIAIRIVNALAQHYDNIHYYIAGSGEKSGDLAKLIEELGASTHIHMIGEISDARKYQLLEESDFFLLPNHSAGGTDFEGFGISFIEASLLGNVVIGGKQGGAKEAIKDNYSGYLFDFDQPNSIDRAVETISQLLDDREKIKEIQCNGQAFVNVNFDWNKLIDQFLQSENGTSK